MTQTSDQTTLRSRLLVFVTIAFATLQMSCGEPTAPTTGSLHLQVTGLPAEIATFFIVHGSRPFLVESRDTVITDLEPGEYTVGTPGIKVPAGYWVPALPDGPFTIVAGRTTTITIPFERWQSSLAVVISGLPTGSSASIEARGPGFYSMVPASDTFVDLKAASYEVNASDVIINSITYRPTPATQTVTLPNTASPVTATITYAPVTASIGINLVFLPQGASASITVTGPGGYSQQVTGNILLYGLAPGTYQLSVANLVADGVTYLPLPSTQQFTIAAGSIAQATVTFRGKLGLQPVLSGLTSAVYLTAPPSDNRLFVVQRSGQIRIVRDGQLLPAPFLDLSSRVSTTGERGLLSMAFDPLYASNGFFYVYFTDALGDITIERFGTTADPDVANPAPTSILSIPHRDHDNHNGGMLMFGPEGYLWTGTGDGGGAGDPLGNAQNPDSRLGKMLTIDFATNPATVRVFGTGLRNPWRFDIRPMATGPGAVGEVFIADVGQNLYEEIDVVLTWNYGVNFGWNVREGFHCYPSGDLCPTIPSLQSPVHEYGRSLGCSITGGFVYRGPAIGAFRDKFTFSDYCGGWLRTLSGGSVQQWDIPAIGKVVSFGEDAAGEQYMITDTGNIWKIVKP